MRPDWTRLSVSATGDGRDRPVMACAGLRAGRGWWWAAGRGGPHRAPARYRAHWPPAPSARPTRWRAASRRPGTAGSTSNPSSAAAIGSASPTGSSTLDVRTAAPRPRGGSRALPPTVDELLGDVRPPKRLPLPAATRRAAMRIGEKCAAWRGTSMEAVKGQFPFCSGRKTAHSKTLVAGQSASSCCQLISGLNFGPTRPRSSGYRGLVAALTRTLRGNAVSSIAGDRRPRHEHEIAIS